MIWDIFSAIGVAFTLLILLIGKFESKRMTWKAPFYDWAAGHMEDKDGDKR